MHINDSQRLTYRLINKNDAQALFDLDNDPEVMRYITLGKTTPMEDVINIAIPRFEKYTNAEQGWGLWKVDIKATNTFIGWVLVRPFNFFSESPEFDNLELGWRFMQKSWGQGYATEAALSVQNALIELAKSGKSQVTTLSAIANVENIGSISVMKKLGMTYQKTYVEETPYGDIPTEYYQRSI